MNKVFKVIWSEARNAYVVVSEIAKNHGSKSCSTKKLLTMLIATGVMTCASMAPAMASNPASDDLNVTIGKGAHVSVWNGVTGKNITGDIAVGPNAHAWNGEYSYGSEGRIGSKEYLLDFGQGGVVGAESFFGIPYKYKVADGSKIAGSIAIGKNTVARTGSVMLGDHSYTGKLGDIEINPANAMTYNDGIYSTTLGAGAYNSGSLAAVTGALSIASGEDTQNTGATIYGSMNSIESATSNSKYSGVASSVLGFANRTQNANAALIWGTGNEVTNSVEKIGIDTDWNNVSVAEAQQKAIEAMQSSKYAGGSVMAIGGGNKADYATYSQLTGVQNKVTGTKAKAAKYDFVNGYQNTVTEASDVTVIGSKNEVTADGNKVIGDNHKVSGKNNVIFGSADKLTETTVNNAVVLGHNAKVTGEGGVALGVGSVADRANAVSVGSTGANRQIINVAAGEADTDAVNVSQLKKATANANKGWKLSTEGGTANQVASEATVNFSGKKDAGGHQNITVSNEGNNVKIELASELKNVTGVVNGNSRVTLGTGIAGITNGQESVIMMNGSTTINGVVGIDNTGKISGVANGEISATSKDAVNGSQLHQTNQNVAQNAADIATNKANIAQNAADIATNKADIEKNAADITQNKADIAQNKADIKNLDNRVTDVEEVAKKHTTVTKGDNIVVSEDTNADGGKEYKVALKNDITLAGDAGDFVSISGSKGTIWASGSVAAGNVVMDGATATVSGLGNKTTAYDGFANGKGKAATEEQLKEVATEAGKHTQVKAGTNVGVVPGKTADGTNVYTVNADGTTVSGDSNVVVTAGAKDANNVTNYGVKLNKDLQGIESVRNGGVKLALNGADGTAGLINGKGASIFMMNGSTTINGVVGIDNTGKISGVANGVADKDAVNVSQLKDVKAEAGKHTTLSDGKNTTVESTVKDGQTDYKVNVAGDLTDITSVVNGGAKLALNGAAGYAGIVNGKGASVYLQDGYTKINNQVIIDQDGKISGVAAGTADTDAVNLGQLKDVKAEAGKHTTLSDGKNTTVESTVKDGQTDYKVNVAGDLTDITSVVNGGAKLALNGAAGYAGIVNGKGASVYLQDGYTKINNQVIIDQDGKISGVAAGTADTDAVNLGQLKDVKAEAGKHTTLSDGKNTTVESTVKDGQTDYKVNVAGDLTDITSVANGGAKLALNGAAGYAGIINGKGASVYLQDGYTKINNKVIIDQDGKISGVAAGKISADSTDAVNGSQLNAVATEAGKHSKVVNGTNTNVEESTVDGQKVYKVNLNNNVMVGDVNGKYVSISGTNGTVEATGAIATKDRVYADKGGKLADIDVTGNTISNGDAKLALNGAAGTAGIINGQGASVYMQGSTTVINSKVSVDKDGKISGVAAGTADTDAVNVSQLQKAAAASATTVSDGVNTTVTATKAKDGHVDYKVNLNKNLTGVESISNGGASLTMNGFATELANGQGASVKLFGDTTTINGKVNVYKDGRIAGVADGVNANDAVNVSQLQKAAAASATTVSDGVNTTVTATKAEDGHTDYKVNLNKDLVGIESISNGDAKLTLGGFATELANGQGASVKLFGDTTTINNAVTVYKDGRISGVADGINNNDAVNVGQLNKVSEIANKGWNLATNGVATEATNVKPGDYVDFSGDKNISISHDGTKVKVELNKDIDVNSVQTNALNSKYNLSVGTMAENGIMPFFVNSTGAFYAASNKFSVDKDGNMNANSVQTNALNSKYNLSVGTANENGIVPFFVNSNGAFYAANNNFSVDKDGKVIATAGEIGNVVLNNGVYTGHSALRDGELFVGDASGNYSQITTKGAKLGKVTVAEDGKISGVAAGEVSSTSTDAINGSQLHQTNENVAALDKRVTQNEADIAANKANIAQNAADIAANKANIAQNAADIATNKANIAQNAADIAQNKADIAQNKADIAQNKADIAQNKTDIKNLDNRVTNVEELAKKHTTVTAGDNITVTEDTNKDGGKEYKVALDKDIKLDSVTTGQTVMNNDGLKVGDKVSVTATAVTAGKTSISDEGVKVGDKTYISDKGLNANDQKVTNVAAGEISATSKDAVNGSQLYATNQEVANNTNRINQLGSRVNKVGAGAAALAALHPMDFDPDDKLTFSAGYGNYGGENAAAIGAYYRPDEKVMFSVGGTVGNGENMVNAGVSFSLDRTNHVSNSRTAMAREILDLRAEVTELKAMVAKGGLGSIAEDKMKIFPDVAENHWAYEYVGKLAAAGIIEGYPDGNFSGDRMMSRYEFAAMLYRAMQKGAQLDSKIINEFAPEMGRIRVDRISGEDGDRDKIERVRVNAVKGERDHYGNKIAKAEAKAK